MSTFRRGVRPRRRVPFTAIQLCLGVQALLILGASAVSLNHATTLVRERIAAGTTVVIIAFVWSCVLFLFACGLIGMTVRLNDRWRRRPLAIAEAVVVLMSIIILAGNGLTSTPFPLLMLALVGCTYWLWRRSDTAR